MHTICRPGAAKGRAEGEGRPSPAGLIGAAQGEHETKEVGRLRETARRLLDQLVSGRGVLVEAACGWN